MSPSNNFRNRHKSSYKIVRLKKTIAFNILKDGDRHLKGQLAQMIFDRIYSTHLKERFDLLPALWLQREVRPYSPGRKPGEQEILRATSTLGHFLTPNLYAAEDIKFMICRVAHGHGHPTFDYIGVDKIAKRKIILDVKSGKHAKETASISFSANEKEVIQDAKALKFDVYVAYVAFLRNWQTEMTLRML